MSAGVVEVVEKERGLTVEETSQRLGVSEPRVYQMLREGSLRGRREGGRWVLSEEDVTALLARRVEEARAHYEKLSLLTLLSK
jgi:excisionase family DNA binding protein